MPFTAAHLPGAQRLSQAAGWPHREADWALTLSVSRGVAAMQDGQVVGTGLCAHLGPVAALNMIIVETGLRGAGLGRRLMAALLKLAEGRSCRLVATEMGLPLYRRFGFVETGRILKCSGTARAATPERPVVAAGSAKVAALAAADRAATGLSRADLLAGIAARGTLLETEGGIALLRRFGTGYVVGPLLARSDAAARALLSEAARRRAGADLRIDMPLPQAEALVAHATTLGLHPADGTGIAMARAPLPADEPSALSSPGLRAYALVSQALG
ncbi:GNAT family N-acetyltransferase [Mesobaculum littorinae]|uniref:GNAT family N-acetyltransferase n=1 Tax=Mesobaculum littorinae TaxID=2486419 RepID=UPI0013E3E858|nr:GNAT family N-acetyltransferase [Mesobaculum littorinae]